MQFDTTLASLKVKWSDQHESTHRLEWLLKRRFDSDAREKYLQHNYRPKRRLWTKQQFESTLKTFEFNDLIETDDGELKRIYLKCSNSQ